MTWGEVGGAGKKKDKAEGGNERNVSWQAEEFWILNVPKPSSGMKALRSDITLILKSCPFFFFFLRMRTGVTMAPSDTPRKGKLERDFLNKAVERGLC